MKQLIVILLLFLIVWSCTNSGSKSSIERSEAELQLLQKITNANFKAFVETFAFGKFPWDVSETPLFTDGEVPANFHKMSLEDIKKFINPDVKESKGYYTGYAIFENEYIAIIYFSSYSSAFGGDNYHTTAYLLTYSYDGTLIDKIALGLVNTFVNSIAERESQKMEGNIYSDNITTIITISYLKDKPDGSGTPLNFLIKANGEIEQTDASAVENSSEDKLSQYIEKLSPSEGLIPVRNNDSKWGYVNEDGKVLIECQYEGASSFENGKAVVKISSDEDWQKNYQYIDANGNLLGLFFDKIDGTSCAEATVVKSRIDEEFSEHHLSNCPDGVRSVAYQGYNNSGGETFYPNENIEQLIPKLANTANEFGPIFKKFDGSSVEYKDGDFSITITVSKNAEGIITSASFSKSYNFVGSRTFEQTETGVKETFSFD